MPLGGIIVSSLTGSLQKEFVRQFEQKLQLATLGNGVVYSVLHLVFGELELLDIGIPLDVSSTRVHYSVANSFQDSSNADMSAFAAKFRTRFGSSRIVSNSLASAYTAFQFWALGAQLAGSFDHAKIRQVLYGRSLQTPQGQLRFNSNHHTSKQVFVGVVHPNNTFSVLHETAMRYPEPWSLLQDSTRQLACDWSAGGGGGNFSVPVVKVGVLVSTSGSTSTADIALLNIARFTVDALNTAGGVVGNRVIADFADCGTNDEVCAAQASLLINDGASFLFGVRQSSARHAVRSVVDAHDALLFYPTHYEGQECGRNIFYGGAVPNQRIEPVVAYAMAHKSRNFFLAVAPTIYGQVTSQEISHQIANIGGILHGLTVVAEASDLSALVDSIKSSMPSGGGDFE